MTDEQLRPTGLMRRYAEVLSCVALWMALGWLLHLETNQYLLLGVPITLAFQLLIRRQPLPALWVREAPPFRLSWKGSAIACSLALLPLLDLIGAAASFNWVAGMYGLCAVGGAIGAAYTLLQLKRAALRSLVFCLLIGLALDTIQWTVMLSRHYVEIRDVEGGFAVRILIGIASLVEYFAVCFALEEVSFRMLDSHLHQGYRRRGVFSALLISAIWGLWHLPIAGSVDWAAVGVLLLVHVPFGLSLSLFWRQSGNLTVPALSHALGDAIRNAILYSG